MELGEMDSLLLVLVTAEALTYSGVGTSGTVEKVAQEDNSAGMEEGSLLRTLWRM